MGQNAFTPQSIVNLPPETLVGNPDPTHYLNAVASPISQFMLLWIAGLPTSDPRVVGSPFLKTISGVQVIAVSQSPGLSGPITCDLATIMCDSVAITCDKVSF